MRYFIICCIFLFSLHGFSQNKDTLYYGQYWGRTTKQEAKYYRPIPLNKKDGFYIIKDYYIDGNLQMKGYSKSNIKDTLHGKIEWYYPNGQLQLIQHYKNGERHGNQKSYFADGSLMTNANYINNIPTTGTYYKTTKGVNKTQTFKNGRLQNANAYYQDGKTIARKEYYNNYLGIKKRIYYDKKGKEIRYNYPNEKIIDDFLSISKTNNVLFIFGFLFEKKDSTDTTVQIVRDLQGNILAKGTIKSGYHKNGNFLQNHQLVTYKNGIRHGEAIFYNQQYQIVAKGNYKNGQKYSGDFHDDYSKEIVTYSEGKVVKKTSTNLFTNQTYQCTFEGSYKPLDGEHYSLNALKTYKDGKLTRQIDYNYYSGAINEITFFEDVYTKSKKIFYRNGKQHTLIYKNGIPFKGKKYSSWGYETYNNGETNGPFIIQDKAYTVKGNYIKNHKEDGEIIYIIKATNDTLKCVFKNGKPITGNHYDLGNLTPYKNGKKEGCGYKTYNNRKFEYDSLSICYKNDRPTGTAKYFLKNKWIANAKYKNGKPHNGTFYNFSNKKVLKNGKLVKAVIANGVNFIKQRFFEDEKIVKEIVDYRLKDSIQNTIIFKNGEPFQGTQVVYDSINHQYIITNFKSGKKDGFKTTYKNFYNKYLSKIHYKHNKKEGESFYNAHFSDSTFTAVFKNDKPVKGVVIDYNLDYISKLTYSNAELQQIDYYGNFSEKLISSITYKNKKPFNGSLFYYKNKERIIEIYDNWKLTKTFINAYVYLSKDKIEASNEVHHLPEKDSIVVHRNLDPNITISYSNAKKTSGKIEFYKNDSLTGQASFKDKVLKQLKYVKTNRDNTKEVVEIKNKIIQYRIAFDDMRLQLETDITPFSDAVYFSILSILNPEPQNAIIKLYIKNEQLGELIMKNGKRYQGAIGFPDTLNKGLYRLEVFENGKRTQSFNNLTKNEMLKKIKAYQK